MVPSAAVKGFLPFSSTSLEKIGPNQHNAPSMKYQLETSPVWDVYREGVECPLCVLLAKAERHYVDFFLGNSVMAPEMRAQVNKTGFCPHHSSLLLEGDNRLGLALMTHTHLLELTEKLQKLHKGLRKKAERNLSSSGPLVKELKNTAAFVEKQQGECLICSRLESTAKRYAYTILYLWERDEACVIVASMKVYARTAPALEASYQTSFALERMQRDIRDLGALSSITVFTPTALTFSDSAGDPIAFALAGGNLTRNGDLLARGVTSLAYRYWRDDGTPATLPGDLHLVEIDLTVQIGNQENHLIAVAFPRVLGVEVGP
jgi:hypothetical protein